MNIRQARIKDKALVAEVCLRLEAARAYGLVTGGPNVDEAACHAAIEEAKAAGVTYTDEEVAVATERELGAAP